MKLILQILSVFLIAVLAVTLVRSFDSKAPSHKHLYSGYTVIDYNLVRCSCGDTVRYDWHVGKRDTIYFKPIN